MQQEPLTSEGFEELTNLLNDMKVNQKPKILKAVDEARQLGDLKENAEYHAAKEEQANIEKRISQLEDTITKAVVIDPSSLNHDKISFYSNVILIDLDDDKEVKYKIVSSHESNPDIGHISFHSPLAKQLLGKMEGDEIIAKLPAGQKEFEVEKIYYEK